jgi:GAF domain-containing protein
VPATTTTIDCGQREGLYELVRNHLGGIEDFFVALERTEDFAKAEQLAVEFAEDFRLLQDIGWGRKDEREMFDLTMPGADLLELLGRLHGEAVEVLVESGSEAQSSREDAETDRRLQLGYEACNKLLADLDPREEDRGRPARLASRRSRSHCPHGDTP